MSRRGASSCSSRAKLRDVHVRAATSRGGSSRTWAASKQSAAGAAYAGVVRILVVSQMYPGPDAPDLGTFVAQVERALVARGHEVDLAVLDTRAGGKLRYLTLAQRTIAARSPTSSTRISSSPLG